MECSQLAFCTIKRCNYVYVILQILEAMKKDSGIELVTLQVDGGMTGNSEYFETNRVNS